MVEVTILELFGARKKTYKKGAAVYNEGSPANFYFQVISGEVKMTNYNDDGKEFIQGIFSAGDSFGEPPLLNGKLYLTNAVALTDSEMYVLPKPDFLRMLHANPDTAIAICIRLADRLYYKSIMAAEISSQEPEHRLLKLFDFLKYDVAGMKKGDKYNVTLTRQQLADLTGLRVETVIRSIKALEKKGDVVIDNRKVFR